MKVEYDSPFTFHAKIGFNMSQPGISDIGTIQEGQQVPRSHLELITTGKIWINLTEGITMEPAKDQLSTLTSCPK